MTDYIKKMKHYEIYLNNVLVKSYPFKLQAIIWCFLNKYVNSSRKFYFFDSKVEIKEVENE